MAMGYQVPQYEPVPKPVADDMDYGAIGNAMSGLGNLIDLPGSMVRDAISFSNPFDQLMSPMSSDNRTSGAEISRYWMGGDENSGGNQMAGLLIDILTDPMMLMTGGTAAAGRMAGKAGMSAAKGLKGVGKAAQAGYDAKKATELARLTSKYDPLADQVKRLRTKNTDKMKRGGFPDSDLEEVGGNVRYTASPMYKAREARIDQLEQAGSRFIPLERQLMNANAVGAGARAGARQLGDEMYSGSMAGLRGARDQAMGLGRRVLGGDRNAMLQSAAIAGNTANTMGGIHQNQEPTIEDMIAQALMQDPDLSEQLLMILSGE